MPLAQSNIFVTYMQCLWDHYSRYVGVVRMTAITEHWSCKPGVKSSNLFGGSAHLFPHVFNFSEIIHLVPTLTTFRLSLILSSYIFNNEFGKLVPEKKKIARFHFRRLFIGPKSRSSELFSGNITGLRSSVVRALVL